MPEPNPQLENGHIKIANKIIEALMLADLNGTQFKLIITILRQTYGWNKKEDYISISRFHKLTNLPYQLISRELVRLEKRKIIIATSIPGMTKKYTFQKKYRLWLDNHYQPISLEFFKQPSTKKVIVKKEEIDDNPKPISLDQSQDSKPNGLGDSKPIGRGTLNFLVEKLSTNWLNTKDIKDTIIKDIRLVSGIEDLTKLQDTQLLTEYFKSVRNPEMKQWTREEIQAWNKGNFSRHKKSAELLYNMCQQNLSLACKVIYMAPGFFGKKNLSWEFETIIKRFADIKKSIDSPSENEEDEISSLL